jgi:hypothetical protein
MAVRVGSAIKNAAKNLLAFIIVMEYILLRGHLEHQDAFL